MDRNKSEITAEAASKTVVKPVNRHVIDIPFINQYYSWDCGLACVSMILSMFAEPCDDVYTKDLDSLQCGENIWTIDLAYLLYRHNVQACFYTITLGVHPSHSKKSFYQKGFTEDNERVTGMFDKAQQLGICVEERSLSMEEVLDHLQDNNPVIALVDWTLMHCVWCANKLKKCWSCITCHHGPYHGHYVVLCGFDRSKNLIFYKNPDCSGQEICGIEMDQFDRARKSDGTDEDTLFIYNQPQRGDRGDGS